MEDWNLAYQIAAVTGFIAYLLIVIACMWMMIQAARIEQSYNRPYKSMYVMTAIVGVIFLVTLPAALMGAIIAEQGECHIISENTTTEQWICNA